MLHFALHRHGLNLQVQNNHDPNSDDFYDLQLDPTLLLVQLKAKADANPKQRFSPVHRVAIKRLDHDDIGSGCCIFPGTEGQRHSDVVKCAVERYGFKKPVKQSEQGFVDKDGEYLDRIEAYKRAVFCGQVEDDGRMAGKLFSEMLW